MREEVRSQATAPPPPHFLTPLDAQEPRCLRRSAGADGALAIEPARASWGGLARWAEGSRRIWRKTRRRLSSGWFRPSYEIRPKPVKATQNVQDHLPCGDEIRRHWPSSFWTVPAPQIGGAEGNFVLLDSLRNSERVERIARLLRKTPKKGRAGCSQIWEKLSTGLVRRPRYSIVLMPPPADTRPRRAGCAAVPSVQRRTPPAPRAACVRPHG